MATHRRVFRPPFVHFPARCATLLVCALSFLLPLDLDAQLPDAPDSLIVPGVRLRLELADPPRSFDGRLRELRGDTLILEDGGVRTSVPAADVARAQVLRRAPTLSRNITIGGVVGMLGAAGMYLNWCADNRTACRRDGQSGYDDDDESPITLGALAIVGGALLGGAVGYALTPTQWVDVDAPIRIGVAPRGGIRISASLPFR